MPETQSVRALAAVAVLVPEVRGVADRTGVLEQALAYHLEVRGDLVPPVKKGFDYQLKSKDVVYIDDYAHHPSEIEAAIKSAKELYPGMHTTVIFQPHLYSRTRDFADGFASSLSLADTTILLSIYPARELPIANVNSEMIKNKMTGECELCEKSDLLEMLTSSKTALVMTLGAGDIDTFVAPVRQLLNKKINAHQ